MHEKLMPAMLGIATRESLLEFPGHPPRGSGIPFHPALLLSGRAGAAAGRGAGLNGAPRRKDPLCGPSVFDAE